jgi:hypothetical protein
VVDWVGFGWQMVRVVVRLSVERFIRFVRDSLCLSGRRRWGVWSYNWIGGFHSVRGLGDDGLGWEWSVDMRSAFCRVTEHGYPWWFSIL